MSSVLTNKIKLGVKRTCALIAGVILCRWIFVPLFSASSAQLFLLMAPMKSATLLIITQLMLDASALSVSGFVTGVIVSSLSTNREIRTTVLASLVVTVWFVIDMGFILFSVGPSGGALACYLLDVAVSAIGLLASAVIGAWLIARKRQLRDTREQEKWSGQGFSPRK